jgi:hypothetical protein
MAEYNVRLDDQGALFTPEQYSISVARGAVAENLSNLNDVLVSDLGNKDQYVLVYDASLQKYKLVNPDVILNSAASTETNQPGLVGYATAFINRLDTDLDDKIDIDAGTF